MNNLVPKDTTFDRLEKYYLENGELSEKDLEICNRLELVFSIFCQTRSKKAAISKFIALQEAKGKGISVAQAYRDLSEAEKLFAPIRKFNKEFLRMTIIESAINDIKECSKRARTASDKMWVAIMGVKDSAEKRIIEASGLKLDDPNLPDFSKLIPQTFNVGLSPEHIKMLEKITAAGVIDLNDVTDIDFEEI